jgi:hypothetical protein
MSLTNDKAILFKIEDFLMEGIYQQSIIKKIYINNILILICKNIIIKKYSYIIIKIYG